MANLAFQGNKTVHGTVSIEISPSGDLRKWYNHDTGKWREFKERYKEELKDREETLDKMRQVVKENKKVAFVYSAKNEDENNAVALKEFLAARAEK